MAGETGRDQFHRLPTAAGGTRSATIDLPHVDLIRNHPVGLDRVRVEYAGGDGRRLQIADRAVHPHSAGLMNGAADIRGLKMVRVDYLRVDLARFQGLS